MRGIERDGYKMTHAGEDGKSNGVGHSIREVCKDVVGVERWQGRIIVSWMMVKKQLVFIMYVSSNRKGGDREKGLSEELSSMVGLVEAHVMLCIAGYYNGNVGTTELGE